MENKYNGGITVDPNIAAILDDLRPDNPTARVEVFQPLLAGKPDLRRQAITLVDKQLDLSGALFEGRYGIQLCDLTSKRTGANTSVTMTFDLAPGLPTQKQHD